MRRPLSCKLCIITGSSALPAISCGMARFAKSVCSTVYCEGCATAATVAHSGQRPLPLLIVGDGNLRAQLNEETAKRGLSTVAFCGQMPHRDTLAILRGARFLVYPSECYEQCPLTILEAYACGVPVIASALGGMQELVDHGRTGILFRPGDPEDLAEKVQWAWSHVRETLSIG